MSLFSTCMCIVCDIILCHIVYNTDPNVTSLPVKVRLGNESIYGEDASGRVDVLYAEEWGTICGHSWDLADATVICRQLGYAHALRAISYVTTVILFNACYY